MDKPSPFSSIRPPRIANNRYPNVVSHHLPTNWTVCESRDWKLPRSPLVWVKKWGFGSIKRQIAIMINRFTRLRTVPLPQDSERWNHRQRVLYLYISYSSATRRKAHTVCAVMSIDSSSISEDLILVHSWSNLGLSLAIVLTWQTGPPSDYKRLSIYEILRETLWSTLHPKYRCPEERRTTKYKEL